MGEGAAAARGGRRLVPQPRMTLLAVAVAGRGLVDPDEPVFRADDEALLRGARRVRDDARLRRPAVPARGAPRALRGLGRRARRCPAAARLEELVALRRRRRAAGSRAAPATAPPALVATAARAARRARGAARARRSRSRLVDVGAPARCSRGAKSTSYGESFAARGEARARGADDALLVARRASCSRRRPRTSGGARRRALHARRSSSACCRASRARVRARARAAASARARSRSTSCPRPTRRSLTSSIREVMPVVAVDGAPDRRRRPGPGCGARCRPRSGYAPRQ